MLSEEEKGFIKYWEVNRLRKKKVWRQLAVGLPLAVIIVVTIFINLFSRWHKEADKVMRREQSSLIIVLIAAALLIVVFIVIFSARHRWDMNEQQYKELSAKEDKP
ncbi:MAG: hypothetical protein KA428_10005 [Chitinophagaceae bacterium]|nr:hypothetical protein [Chitinophagaceae bacterium]